jgi:PKD repeat protein
MGSVTGNHAYTANGSYTVTVNVADDDGGVDSATTTYTVCGKPNLSSGLSEVYWASFGDYLFRLLTVEFLLGNGAGDVANISIEGATNTNGVDLAAYPTSIADMSQNSETTLTLGYIVPMGVENFTTTLYLAADNPCGVAYNFPGEPPSM